MLQTHGSLQARMSEHDPKLYNPHRDLAHCMKSMMERVFHRLQSRQWPELEETLARLQVEDHQVGEAFDALCRYMASQQENLGKDYAELLAQSGWFACAPAAQMAVMATLGTVVLGYHYAGVREATLGGEGPAMDLQGLAVRGEEIAKFLALPRWKRGPVLLWRRLRGALRILIGR